MPNDVFLENNCQIYDVASHGDFHVFSFKEKYFFYDINNMNVYEIGERLYYKLASEKKTSELFSQLLASLKISKNTHNKVPIYSDGVAIISLNVAQVCNLSCVYCYGVDGEYGTKGKMTEETALTSVDFFINQLKNGEPIAIQFFGGEPLLNFQLIKKVVAYTKEQANLKKRNVSFSITTNGSKFSEEVNAFLNKHDFSVIVSFDGDENIQDKNRPFRTGKGSYSTLKPKIEQFLKSRGGNAFARATVTNHSHNLLELKQRLKAMGFKHAGATVATLSEFAIKNKTVNHIDEEQKLNLLEKSDNEGGELIKAIKNRDVYTLKDLSDSKVVLHISQLLQKKKTYFPCGVGRGLVGISIKGDIYPCHRFVGNDDFKMGNVATYDGQSAKKYAESYTQTHPVCSQCWAKYHCGGGGCLHDNYVMKGAIDNINLDHCTRLKNDLKNAIYIFSFLNLSDKEFLHKSSKRENE
ncbi:MAG: 4Fe-4S cluster-binding domain-containing protein [Bacteroidetes bacterium]|nr:4Fe-4S cluster-binding domain-containing protein [Bacteroidota bacterium]